MTRYLSTKKTDRIFDSTIHHLTWLGLKERNSDLYSCYGTAQAWTINQRYNNLPSQMQLCPGWLAEIAKEKYQTSKNVEGIFQCRYSFQPLEIHNFDQFQGQAASINQLWMVIT